MALQMADYSVVITCDKCRGVIATGEEGVYAWREFAPNGEKPDRTVYYLHRSCLHKFKHQRGGSGWRYRELNLLPVDMIVRLSVNLRAAKYKLAELEGA